MTVVSTSSLGSWRYRVRIVGTGVALTVIGEELPGDAGPRVNSESNNDGDENKEGDIDAPHGSSQRRVIAEVDVCELVRRRNDAVFSL